VSTERRFRFDQLDQSGVLLGLGWLQMASLGLSLLVVAVLITVGLPGPLAMVPLGVGGLAAFGRLNGRPVTEWVPVWTSWLTSGRRGNRVWLAPIPYQRSDAGPDRPAALPRVCDGLQVLECPSRWHRVARVGVIHDAVDETMTMLVPVRGRDFVLLEQSGQEEALGRWGETLASFARERGLVVRISWSEYAAPAGLGEHRRWLDSRPDQFTVPAADEGGGGSRTGGDCVGRPAVSYAALVDAARSMTSDHQVIVSLTVARSRLRGANRQRTGDEDPLVDALASSVETLLRGLRNAGVDPDAPLTAAQIDDVLGWRIDPDTMRRRAEASNDTPVLAANHPLAVRAEWNRVRVDGSVNRSYWVAEWPRLPVPTDWLEPLLTFSGAARRAITVLYEPVAPSASKRRIDSESIKLESDAAAREDKGRRVSAQHRRNQLAVHEREQELVEGFVEFNFAGLVTVSADDLDELWEGCAHIEQIFREHGLELRALDGRHDVAWAATLPFGLGLGRTVTR